MSNPRRKRGRPKGSKNKRILFEENTVQNKGENTTQDNAEARKVIEWRPKPKQLKAMLLSIDMETIRNKEEICKEAGIPRKTLWVWEKNPDYIRYRNGLLAKYQDAFLPEVWKALTKLIRRGDLNAIKFYHELRGHTSPGHASPIGTGIKTRILSSDAAGETLVEIMVTGRDED